jgi:hypothetical protein
MNENYFCTLNNINVNEHTEKKGKLTYLSWAWAWAEVKKKFPDATYTIYEAANGNFYHTDGYTCWVKTGVTINGIEHIEYLPVMDFTNKSINTADVTSFDVNKAIQRSLTKACARHGLGLYIYAGEDLPEDEQQELPKVDDAAQKKIYILSINKLLEDTATDGKQMLNFTNEKYGTTAQAFADLNMPQMIWVIRQLENKKEKMNKA